MVWSHRESSGTTGGYLLTWTESMPRMGNGGPAAYPLAGVTIRSDGYAARLAGHSEPADRRGRRVVFVMVAALTVGPCS